MVEGILIILWSAAISIIPGSHVVGMWLLVITPRVSDAIDRTRLERDQLIAERDAFKEFAKRVNALEPDTHTTHAKYGSHSPVAATGITTVVDPVESTGLSTGDSERTSVAIIRDDYRETVMAVPHYEEEYGESVDENLAAELGPELAQALLEGDVLTPQLQAAILRQAQQASKERNDFLSHIETEYDALIEARRRLRKLNDTATTIEDNLYPRPVRELVQQWNRLETMETDCETLLRERQTNLQAKHGQGVMSRWSFQEYLYQSFNWRHPVLNDGLETLRRIRHAERETVKTIYNW